MAHVRRKFVEVEKTTGKKAAGGTAHAVLDLIGKLYGVERQACAGANQSATSRKIQPDPGQAQGAA
nr:IS66 family transposase [Solidesulfovibrio aerotolerans]